MGFAALLVMTNAIAVLDRQLLSLFADPIKAHLDMSDADIGLIYGAVFTVAYLGFGLPLATLVDRVSRRNLVALSLIFTSVSTALFGLSRTTLELVLARIGLGASESCLTPSAMSLLADLYKREQLARAISFYQFGIYIGNALALVIGAVFVVHAEAMTSWLSPVLGELKVWQSAFILAGLPSVVLAICILVQREPPRQNMGYAGPAPPIDKLSRQLCKHPVCYAAVVAAMAALILVGNGEQFWLPAMMHRKFGWELDSIGLVLGTLTIACGGAGLLIGGYMADRFVSFGRINGRLLVTQIAAIALIPLTVLYPLASSVTHCLILAGLAQFFSGFGLSGGITALLEITPNHLHGRLTMIYVIAVNVSGSIAGPAFIGAISDHLTATAGQASLPLAMALVSCLVSPLALILLHIGRRTYPR